MRQLFVIFWLSAALWPAHASAWTYRTSKSSTDGREIHRVHLKADTTYPIKDGVKGRAQIQILCEEKRTVFALAIPALRPGPNVAFSIDNKPAENVKLLVADDHASLGLIGRGGIQIMKKLMGPESLSIRVLPASGTATDITFTIAGFDKAIAPIRKACRW